MTPQEALKQAIETCGGEAVLARHVGVTPQAVNQWDVSPPLRVLEIERATNGAIQRHQLRPDLYPSPNASEAA